MLKKTITVLLFAILSFTSIITTAFAVFAPITVSGYSSNNYVYLDWDPLPGLGTDFDYYQVYSAKGSYNTMPSSAGYWNITTDSLDNGPLQVNDWWSYQVTPVKLKDGKYVEVGRKSEIIKIQVKGTSETPGTPTITTPTNNAVLTNYPRTAYLAWNSATNAAKYEIELACDVCTSTQTKWLNPTTYTTTNNYYTTPALAGDNEFRFKVRALNSSGTAGSWSDYRYFSYNTSSYAATPGTPIITTPTNNAVLTNYPRTAYLAWNSATNAAKYEIELVASVNGSWGSPTNYSTTNTYYTTPALAGDYYYYFRVRALNSSGTAGPWSDYRYFSYNTSSTATPGTPVILAPANNAVLTNYPRQAYLEWNNVSTATKYEIELFTFINGSWGSPTNHSTTNSYYTTPALAGDYYYYFRVRALNSSGTASSWSDNRYFSYNTSSTATPGTPVILTPYNNEVLTNYPRKAYMEWSNVSTATKYEIELFTFINGSWGSPTNHSTTNSYYTTPALAGDYYYYFRVRALNSSGTASPWSDNRYFSYDTSGNSTNLGTPTIMWPLNNTVLTNYPRKAYLEWSEVGSASKYEIQLACEFCSNSKAKWTNPSTYTTSNLYYTTPALAGDYKFRFKVRAINSKNIAGSWSEYRYFEYDTSGGTNKKTLPPAEYEDDVITNYDDYENPFSDTDLSTLEGIAAAELYRRGIIGGYEDGEFKGYRTVNRAEIAKFLLLAKYGEVSSVKNNGKFSDVKEGEWYVKYVVTAYNKGIINGYSDGTFKPGNPVSIAEALKMIALTFNLKLNLSYDFKDVDSKDWFAKYAGIVEKYDLLPKKDKYLNPGSKMTRNEVAVAIYQYLKNK